MLSGSVGIIKVGADSKVALKEKKDRVEDAIYALKEGIVPGGGIALCNAADNIKPACPGEEIMVAAMKEPFNTILKNSGITAEVNGKNKGIDVTTGKVVNMIRAGIIDPVLVTKTALKNAASVASTIISADCVISNMREDEGNQ
jgi:chaperonin GroEL